MMGIIGLLVWWRSQKEPFDAAQTFLDAIQSRDWTTVANLVHPEERKRIGLTPERVKMVGEGLIAPVNQRLGKVERLAVTENPFLPTPEEERLYFRGMHFFRLIRSDGKEGALLVVTKTGEGWRVNFSMFLYTLLTEATEKGQLLAWQRRSALYQVGVRQLFVGDMSIPLPPE